MTRKKQFIAGAICPQCSDMDSLVLYADDQSIECISCDYKKTSRQRDAEQQQDEQKAPVKMKVKSKKPSFKDATIIDITNLDE